MSDPHIRPTTLAGFKTLARNLSRQTGLKRTAALDQAARQGGYANWRDLIRRLRSEAAPASLDLHLTAYWRARDRSGRGRETLTAAFSRAFVEGLTKADVRRLRHCDFRLEASDHLVQREDVTSAERARDNVLGLVRTLRFMEATGLKPSTAHARIYPKGDYEKRPPGADHSSGWFDPASGEHCLADEPYGPSPDKEEARQSWADRHQWRIARAAWPGMYNPEGQARLWIAADARRGFPFAETLRALEQLQFSHPVTTWQGVSAPYWPLWASPGALAAGKKPLSRFAPPPPPRSVRYGGTQSRSRNKPDARMPVRVHATLGRRLKRVLRAPGLPWRAYERLNRLRSELDSWAAHEHQDLADERFLALYYGEGPEPGPALPQALSRYVAEIAAATSTLRRH